MFDKAKLHALWSPAMMVFYPLGEDDPSLCLLRVDIDSADDLRIKMCIEKTEEDLTTIHHELGHNFYQRAYKHQPFLFRNSANVTFTDAVGDMNSGNSPIRFETNTSTAKVATTIYIRGSTAII